MLFKNEVTTKIFWLPVILIALGWPAAGHLDTSYKQTALKNMLVISLHTDWACTAHVCVQNFSLVRTGKNTSILVPFWRTDLTELRNNAHWLRKSINCGPICVTVFEKTRWNHLKVKVIENETKGHKRLLLEMEIGFWNGISYKTRVMSYNSIDWLKMKLLFIA